MNMQEHGRFLSNIYDHRNPTARRSFLHSFQAMDNENAREEEWQQYLKWINANVIGPPKETERYSVDALQKMGMIGIYAKQ